MKLEIITRNFVEGEFVTVAIDGKKITRKVYYSATMGDLYINYKGLPYCYYEFMKGYTGDQKEGEE